MTDILNPIPIILCGKTLETGERVIAFLRPDVEVIHFIDSFEYAKDNLPDLLAGRGPNSPSSNQLGTHNYKKPPRAVIFGRAFDPAHVKELNQRCRGTGSVSVAWIAGDPAVKPPAHPDLGYAQKGAENVKRALMEWENTGVGSEDVIYY
ncbi:hypothetical protein F4859DRAFT_525323 [Xylaria cf. heliscus]|nr:hypothetical protein F4859DRAFT_525323 [Xylaria cf. heliscus]